MENREYLDIWKIEIKCPAIGILPNLKCELRFAAQSQTLPASPSTGVTVLVSGLSVLGASFLLAWGAETAEKDVRMRSRTV